MFPGIIGMTPHGVTTIFESPPATSGFLPIPGTGAPPELVPAGCSVRWADVGIRLELELDLGKLGKAPAPTPPSPATPTNPVEVAFGCGFELESRLFVAPAGRFPKGSCATLGRFVVALESKVGAVLLYTGKAPVLGTAGSRNFCCSDTGGISKFGGGTSRCCAWEVGGSI